MSETYFPTFKKWYATNWLKVLPFPFSGRPRWQSWLKQSGLPDNVQMTIRSVIDKTGLMQSEKFDVCNELINHFHDGLNSDGDLQKVLDKFGDVELTAKLIRRSKQRNRSMFQKTIRAFGWCSLTLTIAYGGLWAVFAMGQPNPTIDYVKDLNIYATMANENDRAWPIYRESWIEYGFGSRNFETQIYATGEQGDTIYGELVRPGEKNWPTTVAFLKEHDAMFEAFREAAKRPALGLEIQNDISKYDRRDWLAISPSAFDDQGKLNERDDSADSEVLREVDQLLICTLLPHVHLFRKMSRHLTSDTYLAIEENDSDRALTNLKSIFGFADHASEPTSLVCGLVGLAVAKTGLEQIEFVLTEHPEFFSENELRQLRDVLVNLNLGKHIKFEGERAMFYDLLQRQYTDDGNGDGRMTLLGQRMLPYVAGLTGGEYQYAAKNFSELTAMTVGMPTSMFAQPSRKEMKDKFDEIMDDVEASFDKPIDEAAIDFDSYFQEGEYDGRFRLLKIFFPRIGEIRGAVESRIKQRDSIIELVENELTSRH